jgi:adenosylhomocysteine nucleosidase
MAPNIRNAGLYVGPNAQSDISGNVIIGNNSSITTRPASHRASAAQTPSPRVDVGVLTVIPEETQAVAQVLGLEPDDSKSPSFNCGTVDGRDQPITVAACQLLGQGEPAVGPALGHLKRNYRPQIVMLVDIGGGIDSRVHLGDVVVSTRVIGYDLRKETPDCVIHRGQEWRAPAEIGHAVNTFFAEHGYPAEVSGMLRKGTGKIHVHEGPVGSGNAVIAHRDSEIVQYLRAYSDKILDVDMESGGLGHAIHDQPAGEQPSSWLVIRGISDHADQAKDDRYRYIAAFNAAATLYAIMPYLPVGQSQA